MRPKPGASRSEDPSSLASGAMHASERSRGLSPPFRVRNVITRGTCYYSQGVVPAMP